MQSKKFPRFSADGSHVTLGSDRIKDLTLSVPAALGSFKALKLHYLILIGSAASSSRPTLLVHNVFDSYGS